MLPYNIAVPTLPSFRVESNRNQVSVILDADIIDVNNKLDTLTTSVSTKVDQEEIDDIITALEAKADSSDLSNKADITLLIPITQNRNFYVVK